MWLACLLSCPSSAVTEDATSCAKNTRWQADHSELQIFYRHDQWAFWKQSLSDWWRGTCRTWDTVHTPTCTRARFIMYQSKEWAGDKNSQHFPATPDSASGVKVNCSIDNVSWNCRTRELNRHRIYPVREEWLSWYILLASLSVIAATTCTCTSFSKPGSVRWTHIIMKRLLSQENWVWKNLEMSGVL